MQISVPALLALYQEKKPEIDWGKTVRHISLYRDGGVTRSRANRSCSALLCCIDIPSYYYRKVNARLLFCYTNGHVNIMNPKEQLEDKLHRPGVKSNGYKQGAVLANVFVCDKTDWLVICCRTATGINYMRFFPLTERRVHHTMSAAGNQFIKEDRPYRWQVVPGCIMCALTHRQRDFTVAATSEQNPALLELLNALQCSDTHIIRAELPA